MRKIIVNGIEYRWSVKPSNKFEKEVSIKDRGKWCSFIYPGNITPRMIREYILLNPDLRNDIDVDIKGIRNVLFEKYVDSLLHNVGIV